MSETVSRTTCISITAHGSRTHPTITHTFILFILTLGTRALFGRRCRIASTIASRSLHSPSLTSAVGIDDAMAAHRRSRSSRPIVPPLIHHRPAFAIAIATTDRSRIAVRLDLPSRACTGSHSSALSGQYSDARIRSRDDGAVRPVGSTRARMPAAMPTAHARMQRRRRIRRRARTHPITLSTYHSYWGRVTPAPSASTTCVQRSSRFVSHVDISDRV